MTPTELTIAGQWLYGHDWQSALARAIGVNRVTIYRYATGKAAIPRLVEVAVLGLTKQED